MELLSDGCTAFLLAKARTPNDPWGRSLANPWAGHTHYRSWWIWGIFVTRFPAIKHHVRRMALVKQCCVNLSKDQSECCLYWGHRRKGGRRAAFVNRTRGHLSQVRSISPSNATSRLRKNPNSGWKMSVEIKGNEISSRRHLNAWCHWVRTYKPWFRWKPEDGPMEREPLRRH